MTGERKPPSPIEIDALGERYDAERILQHRKKRIFLVHWKGYTTYVSSWEPTRNFISEAGIHESLLDYIRENGLDVEVVIHQRRNSDS